MRVLIPLAIVAGFFIWLACTNGNPNEDPAVARGRIAYNTTCTACHNPNPAVDGAIGPAVKGASKELLESKIMRGEYPAGYAAKRATKIMPPQPQLKGAIDDLAAFLR